MDKGSQKNVLNGSAIKWGLGVKGLPLRRIKAFLKLFLIKKKVPAAIKLEGRGGGGMALMALPLRK